MLIGFLLIGVVIGAWLGGYQQTLAWVSALGSYFATVVAVVAGVLAWKGVQAQIRATRLPADETRAVLNKYLDDALNDMNQAWRLLDFAYEKDNTAEETQKGYTVAVNRLRSIITDTKILERQELVYDLLPKDKDDYNRVFVSLRQIATEIKRDGGFEMPPLGTDHKVEYLVTQLSHLVKELEKGPKELAGIFDGRTKVPVKHTPMWHAIKTVTDARLEEWRREKDR